MSVKLPYETIRNIRDLGGEITGDGRKIRSGRLIRSGQMPELSEADQKSLSDSVSVVVDFRTDMERELKPEEELPGIEYHHISIVGSFTAGISREGKSDKELLGALLMKPAEAKAYMCKMYQSIALSDYAYSQYASFFRILLEDHEKAVLWHCTAGKDRAGAAAAMIEEILGIPRQVIVEEYLRSNQYLVGEDRMVKELVNKETEMENPVAAESIRYLLGAEQEYIETFFGTVDERFGSFEAFVHEGLRLTEAEVETLKKLYLTD